MSTSVRDLVWKLGTYGESYVAEDAIKVLALELKAQVGSWPPRWLDDEVPGL